MIKNTTLLLAIIFWSGLVAVIVASVIFFTPVRYTSLIEPKITEVAPEDFYAEYVGNEEEYVFIDVRSATSYNELHATGSLNIPLHMLYDERVNLPKKNKKIVLICSGNRASGVAYSYLQHYGFANIRRIPGGIEAWVKKGLPVEENKNFDPHTHN